MIPPEADSESGERLRVLQVIGRLNMGGPAHIAALLSGRRFDPGRYETLLVHGSLAPEIASVFKSSRTSGPTAMRTFFMRAASNAEMTPSAPCAITIQSLLA